MERFTYSPIDLEGPTSRLLQLHRGFGSNSIRCTLFDAWLDPEIVIPYEALSYTWGGTDKTAIIEVNGRHLAVTANLYSALKHLRLQEEDRIMWIDAVCINQEDPEERGHQVKYMAKIYKLAERVVIWLGQSTIGSDLLMDCMKGLQQMSIDYACHDWKSSDPRWQQMWSEVRPINRDAENQAVEALLRRDWFTRIWVLQEVAFARVAIVVCGSMSVSGRIFSLVLTRTEKVDPHCQAILDIMPGPSRRDSWWNQNRDLSTLLMKFGQSRAGDARDMIYALLGMSSDANDTDRLRPDYNASTRDLVHRTIPFLLDLHKHDTPACPLPDWDVLRLIRILPTLGQTLLHWAMWAEHPTTIRALLENNRVDLNACIDYQLFPDKPIQFSLDHEKPILWAPVVSTDDIMELFLQDDSLDVTVRDNKGNNLLHLAVLHCGASVVERLSARKDIDLYSVNHQDMTPLALAVENGRHTNVQILLRRHADVYQVGGTPSLLKAYQRWCKIELRGSRDYADFGPHFDRAGRTLLILAAKGGHLEVVRLLLQLDDVNINVEDWVKQTALSYATKGHYIDVVRLLLSRPGLNVNAGEQTALSYAAEHGYVDVFRLLLERIDINVNTTDRRNATALSLAVERGHTEIVRLLLQRDDLVVNAADEVTNGTSLYPTARQRLIHRFERLWKNHENTVFSLAVEHGHTDIVRMLLPHSDLKVLVTAGVAQKALYDAARGGHDEVIRLLLELIDVDVNCKDQDHWTLLSLAASNGRKEVVSLLLERSDVDVNTTNARNETPLFLAAQNGHQHVVVLLLKHDAVDATIENIYQLSPVDAALKNIHGTALMTLWESSKTVVDRNKFSDNYRRDLLMLATQKGDTIIVRYLLTWKDLAVDFVSLAHGPFRETPLSVAARLGHEEIGRLLLAGGANPRDWGTKTPRSLRTRQSASVATLQEHQYSENDSSLQKIESEAPEICVHSEESHFPKQSLLLQSKWDALGSAPLNLMNVSLSTTNFEVLDIIL
jgi:ankyrin repeat protein